VAECRPRIILMAGGEIIADGPTERIMTDMDALKRASVSPPEIAKVFSGLSKLGLPTGIIDMDESAEILSKWLGEVEA